MPTHTGRVFEIYSIGDGLFMRRVIDSVAAMSNAGLLIQLVALGLMIGLIVMGFKNVIAGGNKLDLGSTLVSVLLGMIMFGMRADVVIHDMNFAPGESTVNSYPVANVPFGIAAAGYIISGVSYNLTLKLEQGYGLYGGGRSTLIEGGFGNTLEWINSIRSWREPAFDSIRPGQAGGESDISVFRKNLGSYINKCLLPGIQFGHKDLSVIMRASNVFSDDGIKYQNNWLMTEYTTNTSQPVQSITCTNAYYRLEAASAGMNDSFARAVAISSAKALSSDGQPAINRMTEAYSAIGVTAEEMQKLIISEAAGMSLQNAISGNDSFSSSDRASRIMIEQASAQRAVQWAAEETMFRRIMRPMMAFFETLLYALAPFMALIVGLGQYGLQMIGKYMMITIWVGLWMPVLSIIELFQVTMVQHAVNGMRRGLDGTTSINADITSIASAHHLSAQAVDWLGTGAAMAAMTPAITLMLVWGGSITASALAGRMQGSDTINEKVVAPDAVQSSAGVSVGALSERTAASGNLQGGSGAFVPHINQSQVIGESMQSMRNEMESNGLMLNRMFTSRAQEIASNTSSFAATGNNVRGGETSFGKNASHSFDEHASSNTGKTSSHGSNYAQNDALNRLARLQASLGLNFYGTGAGTGAGADWSSGSQAQRGGGILIQGGYNKGVTGRTSTGESGSSVSKQTDSIALSAAQTSALSETLSKDEAFMKALARQEQLQQSYQEMASFMRQNGTSQSESVMAIAKRQIESGNGGAIQQAFYHSGYNADTLKRYQSRIPYGHDSTQTQTAAMILAMHEGAQSDGYRAAIYADVMNGDASGHFFGSLRPDSFRGVGSGAQESFGVEGSVNEAVAGISIDGNAIAQRTSEALTPGSTRQSEMKADAAEVAGVNLTRHNGGRDPMIGANPIAIARAGQRGLLVAESEGNEFARFILGGVLDQARDPGREDFTTDISKARSLKLANYEPGSTEKSGGMYSRMIANYEERGYSNHDARLLAGMDIIRNDNSYAGVMIKAELGASDVNFIQSRLAYSQRDWNLVERTSGSTGEMAKELEILNRGPEGRNFNVDR